MSTKRRLAVCLSAAFGCVRVDWTKKTNVFLLVCLWVLISVTGIVPYLGTVLKSARQRPEFGLSGLALNAKPKSADRRFLVLLSRALAPSSGG